MRRKLTVEQAREMLLTRLTKGDAFRLSADQYDAKQEAVRASLASLTIAEMKASYPEYTYDWA
jgi:hypothetical protein